MAEMFLALTLTARRERKKKKMRKIAVKKRTAEKEKKKNEEQNRFSKGWKNKGKRRRKRGEDTKNTAAKDATDACVNSSTPSLYARGQYQEDTAAL